MKMAPKAKTPAKRKASPKAPRKPKVVDKVNPAADSALLNAAANQPNAGQGKAFVAAVHKIEEIREKQRELGRQMRDVRGNLKEMKIELQPLDYVLKLRRMEPEDARSFEASAALYKEQLLMPLTPEQKASREATKAKREEAKTTMLAMGSGDAGKEIGTDRDEAETPAPAEDEAPAIPARNDAIKAAASGNFH